MITPALRWQLTNILPFFGVNFTALSKIFPDMGERLLVPVECNVVQLHGDIDVFLRPLRLQPEHTVPELLVKGEILFFGDDLAGLQFRQEQRVRGHSGEVVGLLDDYA